MFVLQKIPNNLFYLFILEAHLMSTFNVHLQSVFIGKCFFFPHSNHNQDHFSGIYQLNSVPYSIHIDGDLQ